MTDKKVVDVYPYCLTDNTIKYLIFHRSSDHIYSKQWRMIGGKVNEGEKSWEAALRELKEETGTSPEIFWTIPSINHFYEYKRDQILYIPAFAAQLKADTPIVLNNEHDDYKWVNFKTINELIFWPEQIKMYNIIDRIIQRDNILPNWIIE